MGQFISTQQEGAVALVTIANPPLNALSSALLAELEEVAPVPEAGELVGHGLAMGIGEPLHLPESDERPDGGEQQSESRQRDGHDGQAADR